MQLICKDSSWNVPEKVIRNKISFSYLLLKAIFFLFFSILISFSMNNQLPMLFLQLSCLIIVILMYFPSFSFPWYPLVPFISSHLFSFLRVRSLFFYYFLPSRHSCRPLLYPFPEKSPITLCFILSSFTIQSFSAIFFSSSSYIPPKIIPWYIIRQPSHFFLFNLSSSFPLFLSQSLTNIASRIN